MKIAVLMSTYNGHNYLDVQLESLLKQTIAEDMTVYIRDDGSTDDTFHIIEKWKEKMSIVLYKKRNVGPAKSFWELIMNPEIQADYYAFCDQDDIWDSNKLEVAVKKLKGNTHFYACNCRIINEKGQIVKTARLSRKPEIDLAKLYVTGCTQGCSMVFSDALRKYIGKLDIQCVPMHDIVLMLYAIYFGKIYWDEEPHFGYRVHFNNVTAKANKSTFEKIRTTCWNWKNSSKNSMADVAAEMLRNIGGLSDDDRDYLMCIANYKHSICCKNKILYNNKIGKISKRVLRSYRLRIALNLY